MRYNDDKKLTDHKVNLTMTSRPIVRPSSGIKPIWQTAAVNNKKRKIVRHHTCRDDSYFSSL